MQSKEEAEKFLDDEVDNDSSDEKEIEEEKKEQSFSTIKFTSGSAP